MFLTVILVFVSYVFVESKTKLEDIVPSVCDINDVNVDDCLRISSQNILPVLAKGIKDWNLIGLDPIVVPSIVIGQESGPISLRWENMNATIRGYSKLNFSGATVSKIGDNYNFALNFTTDKFSMSGDYKARGKMLFFPISNEGYEEIHSGSATLRLKFTAVPEKRNKKEYLKIVKFNLGFDFSSDINVVLRSNNKKPTQLDKLLSNFLNTNTKEIVAEMKPTFEAAFGALIKSYIQKFLEKVPLKNLFKS